MLVKWPASVNHPLESLSLLPMSPLDRQTFWSWYRHGARTDGTLVSAPKRAFRVLIGIAVLIGWWLWTSRTQPKLTETTWRVVRTDPWFALGIVIAFALMSFRGIALEYLAYSVYHAQGIHLKWVLFFGIGERELRRRYEESFGKDEFLRAPNVCGFLSMVLFAVSGLVMVFTSR